MKRKRMIWVLAAVIAGWLAGGAMVRAQAPSPADAMLAQQFSDRGREAARTNPDDARYLHQAAAMLEAARLIDPAEARHARLLADVASLLRDPPRQLEALNALRALSPGDRTAQIEVISLHVARMETVDQKLSYLRGLIGREAIPAEVRGRVAMMCWELLLEQKKFEESRQMVDEAIRLNPLDAEALGLKFNSLPQGASEAERVELLLGMLRANPAGDPSWPELPMTALARRLAMAGMVPESLTWYGTWWKEAQRWGHLFRWPVAMEYVAQLLIGGRAGEAQKVLELLSQGTFDDYSLLMLRLLVERQSGRPEEIEKYRTLARNALVNELAVFRRDLGVASAATQPVEKPIPVPDLAGDVELFRKSQNVSVKAGYLDLVGTLGWFEAYFSQDRAEAERLLKHLEMLSAALEGSPAETAGRFASRLSGWVFLLQGRTEEARVKLSAVADRDPMAALGLIRTYGQQEQEQANAAARKLLAAYPSGVTGAMMVDGLRDRGVAVEPVAEAAVIREALRRFPMSLMDIISRPHEFYALRGEPVKVAHFPGEPLMARIIIQNTSDYDLTIGSNAMIRSHLWLEAQIRGLFAQRFPNLGIERVTEHWILKPRQTISVTVRIDQSELAEFLTKNPVPPITVVPSVRTNAVALDEGPVVSEPGGYAVTFARLMERSSLSPTPETLRRVEMLLGSENARDRFLGIQQVAILGSVMRQAADTDERKAQADKMFDLLRRARADKDGTVRIWAGYLRAIHGPEEERAGAAEELLALEDWRARLLGMRAATRSLPVERRQAAIQPLVEDSNGLVKEYAAATLSLLKSPPATRPTTEPADLAPGG